MTNKRLAHKFEKALNALETLKESIHAIKKTKELAQCANQEPETIYKIYRDSMVKRFEYTFDTNWKYVGEYLEAEGRSIQPKTPKSIYRECLKAKIISDADVRLALDMVDHRNLTTHAYDEAVVEEICKYIPEYAHLFEKILKQTKAQ